MKQILLRRRPASGSLPKQLREELVLNLGSYLEGAFPMNPLDMKNPQHVAWMEQMVNESSAHKDFRQKVSDFWADMTIKVGFTGVPLNITTDENGEPENLQQYLQYLFAKKHAYCGNNEAEMKSDPKKNHYIYDPEEVTKQEANNINTQLLASEALTKDLKTKGKPDELIWELTDGVTNPKVLTEDSKKTLLYSLSTKDPKRYLEASSDKTLMIKAKIYELVEAGVLTVYGTRYVYKETTLGETLKEVVTLLSDSKRNSKLILELEGELGEAKEAKA